jgi:hypothetical protein
MLFALVGLSLIPTVALAKLPFFGLEVTPLDPNVGEQITVDLTWFRDEGHTQPSSCGRGSERSRIAWVHPLDEDGQLDRTDWLLVAGRCTASGAIRGRIVLDERGAYDVLPLWRSWPVDAGQGFADTIRIEVGGHAALVPIAATIGVAAILSAVALRTRHREAPEQARSGGTAD